jgi:putative PIN family toxin of toxin-antitoxin system
MIRVVVDTNVYISALMFGGLPGEFLGLAFAGGFLAVTSPVLLDELEKSCSSSSDWNAPTWS